MDVTNYSNTKSSIARIELKRTRSQITSNCYVSNWKSSYVPLFFQNKDDVEQRDAGAFRPDNKRCNGKQTYYFFFILQYKIIDQSKFVPKC
jgi:hypothetical protein